MPRKDIQQLGPDVSAEGFGFHRSQHRGCLEFFGHLGEQRDVIDKRRTVYASHAESHLGLMVNERDCGVCRRIQFVVFGHICFSLFVFVAAFYCYNHRTSARV